jgi:hypothetical protein
MPKHGDLAIALRSKLIELDDAAFSDEGFNGRAHGSLLRLKARSVPADREYLDDIVEIAG